MGLKPGLKPIGTPREEWQTYNGEYYDPRSGQKIVFTKVNGKSVPVIYTGPSENLEGDMSRSISKQTGNRNFGPRYKESEIEAGETAEKHRAGAGFDSSATVSPSPTPPAPPIPPAPTTPAPSAPAPSPEPEGSGGSDTKISPTGIKQTGKTLGGLEGISQLLSGLTRRDGSNAGISLADTKGMYSSEALPTTPGASRQLDGRPEGESSSGYTTIQPSDPMFAKAFGKDLADKYSKTGKQGYGQKSSGFANANGTVDTEAPSAAGTIQEEDGQVEKNVSNVDQSRAVTGINGAVFGGEGPDTADLVSPMYANKNRNEFRANFLDTSMDSATALRAAEASQGYVVQNGRTFENSGGKLVEIDPAKASDYRNEKAWGRDPGQKFKDGYLKAVVAAGNESTKTEPPTTPPSAPSGSAGAEDIPDQDDKFQHGPIGAIPNRDRLGNVSPLQ